MDSHIQQQVVLVEHPDPFAVLGMHPAKGSVIVRAHLPWAHKAWVVNKATGDAHPMKTNETGLFEAKIKGGMFKYHLRAESPAGTSEFEDPYRFGPVIGEMDLYLWNEGTSRNAYQFMGAQIITHEGVEGTCFAVWAPNARRVSVIGDWNGWDGRVHPMRHRGASGIWELFVPNVGRNARYKFEIKAPSGELLIKADPFALKHDPAPHYASVVWGLPKREWRDEEWMEERAKQNPIKRPMSIYEVHLGSWVRIHNEGNRSLSYLEHARLLVPYAVQQGFTHLELLPIMEHPFEGSWGYQVTGFFAPTSRWGTPEELQELIETCHLNGLGVILDWVPAHFPKDSHALGRFDGTALYEHQDPRQGEQTDWGTFVFNFGRNEVMSFLISNALFWLDAFHFDGLRIDAVASMIYLDFSRKHDEWVPNKYGGRENLEAVEFLKRLNIVVHELFPGTTTIAEESTAWPGVSHPVYRGGLGFGMKWNMGWMHDTLKYFSKDPVHRKYHHQNLTFPIMYAFHENFVLVLSHDEVVHLKGSMLAKMPGDEWQKFSNLRLLYTYLFTQPGKKLVFMGQEFAQGREWDHNSEIEWHLLGRHQHSQVHKIFRDLLHLYKSEPALWLRDSEPGGFSWADCDDVEHSIISYLRFGGEGDPVVLAVLNMTPVVRHNYRIGVPTGGRWTERINSDALDYGGSGVGNLSFVTAEPIAQHGRNWSLNLTLPPLGGIILTNEP